MFRTEELVKTFGDGPERVEALKGITLDIPEGEVFGIVGHSGAGKSTLIRCLNLLERPTSGRVFLDEVELTGLSAGELRRRRQKIGMIFQHFHLFESRTVLGNVAFPLELRGIDKARREARAREILEIVGLADRAHEHPSRLSGGMKQRVGIARALAGSPKVLLCDEATSALDTRTAQQILGLLRDVNEAFGVTVVLITHDMEVVRSACGSAALLSDGRIVESGRLTDLALDSGSALGRLLLPLRGAPVGEDETHLLLTVADVAHGSAALSRLARDLDVDVTIRAGSIERIQAQDVGRFQVALEPRPDRGTPATDAVVRYLTDQGVRTEVLA
ncbi:methionine ABC transporter ATP-binding protein [Oryzobacter telluris]|uniref:methionine ABC transporter ATP-binding protein n=1 Tax=Oryzobacter telluris TaxID=3149179 RepID=UPI00370D4777